MYRVQFDDLEKAIAALRKVVKDPMFCSITGTYKGGFIFKMDDEVSYTVRLCDFTVWRNFGTWQKPDWRKIS